MRVAMLLAALFLAAVPALAAPEKPASGLCVRAQDSSQYNARAIGLHDIRIANAVGDRTPLRAATTCIHLRPESVIGVHAQFQCLQQGDPVGVGNLGLPGEQCRIVRLTPFVPGSEAQGYR